MNFLIRLILLICFLNVASYGQDFFEDINASGTPILENDCKKGIVTPRLTPTDGSIKVNFFRWFDQPDCSRGNAGSPNDTSMVRLGGDEQPPAPSMSSASKAGYGLNLKARASDGIASVFSGGSFANNLALGGYVALASLDKGSKGMPSARLLVHIISLNVTSSSYRFFQEQNEVGSQLTDFKTYVGFVASYSILKKIPLKHGSNLNIGASLSLSRGDNYANLDKVEIKEQNSYKLTGSGTSQRLSSKIDDDGYIYALVNNESVFKRSTSAKLRIHVTAIPKMFDYRIALIFYPEATKQFSGDFKLTGNVAIHVLKEGEPSTSVVGLFVSFNDMTNAANKSKPFLQRSLAVGITTGWDILLANNK